MRQNEVKVGGEYRVKIGGRMAPVIVQNQRHQRMSGERWRIVFDCRTLDTGRAIVAAAARLRPLPGTPEAAAENARKIAAERRRMKAPHKAPAPTAADAPRLVAPAPVPGMVRRVDPARLVEPLVGRNREMVERVVAGVHVGLPWSVACRAVWKIIGTGGRLRGFPKHLRRGAWLKVAEEHAANRRLYIETMGHDPVPSADVIEAAMTGDAVIRAAVIAN